MAGYSLEHYLARAWALHMNEIDGSLTLDERIQRINPREVVDTFVGMLDKYITGVTSEEIYERTLQELSYTTEPCYLWSLLLQTYAEYVLLILRTVKREYCYGCNCTEHYGPGGHPSQRHHTCLSEVFELLDLHFTECLEKLEPEILLTKYAKKLYDLDHVILPSADIRDMLRHELEFDPQL